MKSLPWMLALAVTASVGCGFGDNHRSGDDGAAPPDAGSASDDGVDQVDAGSGGDDAGVDGGVVPPVEVSCELVPQDGCAANQACDLGSDGDPVCREINGNGKSNNRCTMDPECAAGYTCADSANDDTIQWCHRLCEVNADCGTGERCTVALITDQGAPAASACTNSCNVVTGGGCPTGLGCASFEAGAADFTDCLALGTTPDGGSCVDDTDCRNGSLCTFDGDVGSCRSYCKIGGADCQVGELCVPMDPSLSINGESFGGCQ